MKNKYKIGMFVQTKSNLYGTITGVITRTDGYHYEIAPQGEDTRSGKFEADVVEEKEITMAFKPIATRGATSTTTRKARKPRKKKTSTPNGWADPTDSTDEDEDRPFA